MAQNKYLNYEGLVKYDEKIKELINSKDAESLGAAKAYADGLAENYEAAGSVATAKSELEAKIQSNADGIKGNTDAIGILNGEATVEGSVKKAVADAKSELNETIAGVQAEVDAAEGRLDVVEAKAATNATSIGALDNLETTAKGDLVTALNEVRNAVSAGGVSAAVTMDTTTTSEGALKSYTIKQGDNVVGTIDIPKDMVVESGEVVVNPEGQAEGTYIKLVLANVAEPLYVNVGTLVDIYKAKANATQVQVTVDSSTREISAVVVAESITSTELAADSVTTVKIADGNVTKAKLSTAVQTSLDKADAAAPQSSLDAEIDRATKAEAQVLTDAKSYTDGQVSAEKARAEGIEAGLESRLAGVEAQLGTGEGTVDAKMEAAKQAAIDAASADATTKANTAEANAKAHADTEIGKTNANVTKNAEDIAALSGRMDTAESDINALETSLAEGGATALAIADAKKAGTDAQADVDTLEGVVSGIEGRVSANETALGGHGDRLTALEEKVGDGFVAITTTEIDGLFA